ncbi:MAG: hypothetical protein E7Y34_01055 [Mycoplasma sp.]|nr:hypothetical protein [Mycoplasma sp.]
MPILKIKKLDFKNKLLKLKIKQFLKTFDLKYNQVEHTFYVLDSDNQIIASCSSYLNLIKCIAIKKEYQNHRLSIKLINHTIKFLSSLYKECFVITKKENLFFWQDLNFEIIFTNNEIAFLTSNKKKFNDHIQELKNCSLKDKSNFILINANPCTKGHLYLLKKASANKHCFVMVLREDASEFSFTTRYQLVKKATKHLKNITVLKGSPYLLSKSVFPDYFLKTKQNTSKQWAIVDAFIFTNLIAPNLNVDHRYFGSEPYSKITDLYNQINKEILEKNNIKVTIIERKKSENKYISASLVRLLWKENQLEQIKKIVPKATFYFLKANQKK